MQIIVYTITGIFQKLYTLLGGYLNFLDCKSATSLPNKSKSLPTYFSKDKTYAYFHMKFPTLSKNFQDSHSLISYFSYLNSSGILIVIYPKRTRVEKNSKGFINPKATYEVVRYVRESF